MINDLSLLSVLKSTMHWHQARQTVLAENVANADSNNYRARDLKPLSFGAALSATPGAGGVTVALTQAGHISPDGSDGNGFAAEKSVGFETTPDGNGVSLEDQMMKMTENELNYQAATTLYARALALVRTALSRGG